MRKLMWTLGVMALLGVWLASPGWSQWGAIQSGADALRRAKEAEKPPPQQQQPTKAYEGSASMSDTKTGVSTAPKTYQNKVRKFSYTIPAGWRLERGDPTGNAERQDIIFMKPGTTCGFNITWHQYPPDTNIRKANVEASYKSAMSEKSIGKYLSVKRRDQGGAGKEGIIGWETIETAEKGSGGFQRIQWNCWDPQNYSYTFQAYSEPKDFNANRAELQRIIDSIRFSR
ncbi:MAG: hypothetical protein C4567_16855 [Deltaproteobacteria bacterium]|nr:MAG: hypothetical protein C4567_16855 [Deltaproteobacteria bacterium]